MAAVIVTIGREITRLSNVEGTNRSDTATPAPTAIVTRRGVERVLLEVEVADGAQQLERRGHDLRPDPVAGERDDAVRHVRANATRPPLAPPDCLTPGARTTAA